MILFDKTMCICYCSHPTVKKKQRGKDYNILFLMKVLYLEPVKF